MKLVTAHIALACWQRSADVLAVCAGPVQLLPSTKVGVANTLFNDHKERLLYVLAS